MQVGLVDPGVGRVGGDHPQAADGPGGDALHDLVIRPAGAVGDGGDVHAEGSGHVVAVAGTGEVAAAEQVGGVAEQP